MKHVAFLRVITLWGMVALFMTLTNPNEFPVFGLLVPFGLFGIAIYATWSAILSLYAKKAHKQEVGFKRTNILGVFISIVSVFCLGLASLGELTTRDFLTIILFATLGYFYVARTVNN